MDTHRALLPRCEYISCDIVINIITTDNNLVDDMMTMFLWLILVLQQMDLRPVKTNNNAKLKIVRVVLRLIYFTPVNWL